MAKRRRVAVWIAGGAALAAMGFLAAPRLLITWRARALRNVPRPLDVLLITTDTTRADRLGCYGWQQAETPNLDALARQGTLFRQAYAHAPLTSPSHASILTGLLPTRHGVRDNGTYALRRDVTTLAQRFGEAGYRTGAFVSAFVLDRRFGLARGFQGYHDEVPGSDAPREREAGLRSARAEETVGRALVWLEHPDARPRFLWVHLYDPHAPYEAPEPFASRHRERPYEGEIAYMDAQIGRLLAAAGERSGGRLRLTAVVGDHGEGLGEHQEPTHSYFVYSNTQRVPLILALPGHIPARGEVDAVVRAVDLAPTILELAGLPPLPGVDGRSLVPLLAGRSTGEPGPAYVESYHPRLWWGAQELLGVRTGRWLFIESPRPELYDVGADPAERRNLAAARPQELESMRLRLRDLARDGAPVGPQARLDPQAEGRLRALGYLGPAQFGPSAAAGPLPDAKDNAPLLDAVSRGQSEMARGRYEEALARFQEALEKNPRSPSVRMRVAEALLALGRHDDAFAAFAEVALSGFAQDSAYLGMAKARLGQDRADEALKVVRAGLQAVPDSVLLNTHLGQRLLARGQAEEAERAFRKALAAIPGDEEARMGLGLALIRLVENSPQSTQARTATDDLLAWADERLDAKQYEDAGRAYEAVLRTGRASAPIFLNLGLANWRRGLKAEALEALRRGVARFPDSADLHYRMGKVLQGLGRRAEAEASFRRVLELAPGRADAAEALRHPGGA